MTNASHPARLYALPLIVLLIVVCVFAVQANIPDTWTRTAWVSRSTTNNELPPSLSSFPAASPASSTASYLRASTIRPTRRGSSDGTKNVIDHDHEILYASTRPSLASTLIRGALLRISSDFAGGTVFENIKTRVTTSDENMWTATRNIIAKGGIRSLWSGSSSRSVEGALVGALFMLGSTLTKQQLQAMGVDPTLTALCGGLVGGIAQAMIMTPAGMIFTSLNVQRSEGNTDANAFTVTRKIILERGPRGMFSGFTPMAIRQASNWASRAGLTEVARSVLGLQSYGLVGEIGSGVLGGVGSCWNTPIELSRVLMQRDLSVGNPTKGITDYWREAYERDGPTGLYRGVSPRALQAIWQTCFLVVVPNLMGI